MYILELDHLADELRAVFPEQTGLAQRVAADRATARGARRSRSGGLAGCC
jgi:hypothetical protein